MGFIKLDGIKLYGNHGYYDEEQKIGGLFTINIKFEANLEQACESDHLGDTINYEHVYEITLREFKEPSRLLEHVGKRILNGIKAAYPLIKELEIEIYKHHPPMGGELNGVSVILKN
jgi:dihydroneopterin aldolase